VGSVLTVELLGAVQELARPVRGSGFPGRSWWRGEKQGSLRSGFRCWQWWGLVLRSSFWCSFIFLFRAAVVARGELAVMACWELMLGVGVRL
jgi:hypothetical protein